MAVGGYDGMAAIVHVVHTLKGKIETEAALEALKAGSSRARAARS